jgi:hypothetical protein
MLRRRKIGKGWMEEHEEACNFPLKIAMGERDTIWAGHEIAPVR